MSNSALSGLPLELLIMILDSMVQSLYHEIPKTLWAMYSSGGDLQDIHYECLNLMLVNKTWLACMQRIMCQYPLQGFSFKEELAGRQRFLRLEACKPDWARFVPIFEASSKLNNLEGLSISNMLYYHDDSDLKYAKSVLPLLRPSIKEIAWSTCEPLTGFVPEIREKCPNLSVLWLGKDGPVPSDPASVQVLCTLLESSQQLRQLGLHSSTQTVSIETLHCIARLPHLQQLSLLWDPDIRIENMRSLVVPSLRASIPKPFQNVRALGLLMLDQDMLSFLTLFEGLKVLELEGTLYMPLDKFLLPSLELLESFAYRSWLYATMDDLVNFAINCSNLKVLRLPFLRQGNNSSATEAFKDHELRCMIQHLPTLEELVITGKFTYDSLSHLGKYCPKLERLHLLERDHNYRGHPLCYSDIRHPLPRLKFLTFEGGAFTPSSYDALAHRCIHLQKLSLSGDFDLWSRDGHGISTLHTLIRSKFCLTHLHKCNLETKSSRTRYWSTSSVTQHELDQTVLWFTSIMPNCRRFHMETEVRIVESHQDHTRKPPTGLSTP